MTEIPNLALYLAEKYGIAVNRDEAEHADGLMLEHCTACKSMWYSSPRDRLLKNIRQPYEAKLGRSIDIARCPDCTARLKTYERALRELRAHETGGTNNGV